MSTFKVTVERLTIHPHPNADALELAQVGMYRAVVAKGVYKTGDYALYIPEQAVLPPELIAELGLTGRLAGSDKNRVKAVRLRGELSQGIVCRPAALKYILACDHPEDDNCAADAAVHGIDFAQELGITKWVPPVPVGMAGDVLSAPDLMRWIDIENIKRYPDMFYPGQPVVATEKIHGSCCLLTYVVGEDGNPDMVYVSSKGVGAKNLAIQESPTNVYWRAVHAHGLIPVARALAARLDTKRVGLFGEVFGNGVQDLKYDADATRDEMIGYALFDVAYEDLWKSEHFLGARAIEDLKADGFLPVSTAPVLYDGPYDYDALAALAEGREQVSGREVNIREGLVVRPATEVRSDRYGRVIAKFVSEAYLTRSGGTEHE